MTVSWHYIARNLVVRKLTTLLTAGGMALVVFVFATVLMMSEGIRATLVATGQPDNVMTLRKGAGAEINSGVDRLQANVLATLPGIALGEGGQPLVSKESVVLNSLAGEFIPRTLELLAPGGRFVEIGKKDFVDDAPLPLGPFLNSLTYFAIDIAEMIRRDRGAASALREVRELFERGELVVKPLKLFPMDEIASAFRYMGSGRHIGRIGISFR